jgi:ATP-dependent DNA helicase PIF1
VPNEYMACLHQVGVPEHALKLKVGALAMVTRNLNPDVGLLNGSRVCILHVSPHVVKARTLDAARRIVFTGSLRLNFDLPLPNSHLRVTCKQFPLRLANCLTGNNVAGQDFAVRWRGPA